MTDQEGTKEIENPPLDPLAAAQLEKLTLEIKDLRTRNKWEFVGKFMPVIGQFVPVIATILAVLGFFFTVYQYQSQRTIEANKDRMSREVDQTSRFQNQIRSDIDEILRSAGEQKQIVSRVKFLLDDVKTVLESRVNQRRVADIFCGYDRRLTSSLVILVRDDCDFANNPRDVDLANAVIADWPDYSDYLKVELKKLDWILDKYTTALQSLHDQNPGYLEHLELIKATHEYFVPEKYQRQKNAPALYSHFIALVDGFKLNIKVLGDENLSEEAKQIKQLKFKRFQDALGNRTISEYILGIYLPD
jgi:hypothetical protein